MNILLDHLDERLRNIEKAQRSRSQDDAEYVDRDSLPNLDTFFVEETSFPLRLPKGGAGRSSSLKSILKPREKKHA